MYFSLGVYTCILYVAQAGGRGLGHVVLEEVGVAASGVYSCEAVADFPSFSQQLVSANLTVVGKTNLLDEFVHTQSGVY